MTENEGGRTFIYPETPDRLLYNHVPQYSRAFKDGEGIMSNEAPLSTIAHLNSASGMKASM